MNQNIELSPNVLTDDTASAGVLESRATRRSAVEEMRKRPGSFTRRLLGDLLNIIQGTIDKGGIVRGKLRPRSLAPTGLEHAFFEILEETVYDARPPFQILVTGQPRTLSSAIEEQVHRIQREALINAIRHADATNIEAEVEYLPRRLRLVIRDNGCGFEPKVLKLGRRAHCGIRIMIEQARAMGAQLQIWSKPGSGTEVELSLPYDPRIVPALNP